MQILNRVGVGVFFAAFFCCVRRCVTIKRYILIDEGNMHQFCGFAIVQTYFTRVKYLK